MKTITPAWRTVSFRLLLLVTMSLLVVTGVWSQEAPPPNLPQDGHEEKPGRPLSDIEEFVGRMTRTLQDVERYEKDIRDALEAYQKEPGEQSAARLEGTMIELAGHIYEAYDGLIADFPHLLRSVDELGGLTGKVRARLGHERERFERDIVRFAKEAEQARQRAQRAAQKARDAASDPARLRAEAEFERQRMLYESKLSLMSVAESFENGTSQSLLLCEGVQVSTDRLAQRASLCLDSVLSARELFGYMVGVVQDTERVKTALSQLYGSRNPDQILEQMKAIDTKVQVFIDVFSQASRAMGGVITEGKDLARQGRSDELQKELERWRTHPPDPVRVPHQETDHEASQPGA
ncbi:MAG: hypothetical protein AB1486_04525 [Planctomycetota bacterium]